MCVPCLVCVWRGSVRSRNVGRCLLVKTHLDNFSRAGYVWLAVACCWVTCIVWWLMCCVHLVSDHQLVAGQCVSYCTAAFSWQSHVNNCNDLCACSISNEVVFILCRCTYLLLICWERIPFYDDSTLFDMRTSHFVGCPVMTQPTTLTVCCQLSCVYILN